MPGPEDEKPDRQHPPAEAEASDLDDPMFPLPELDLELSEGLEAEVDRGDEAD